MKAAMQSFRRHCAALATTACFAPVAAWAGPPFLADDPEPTETGHWETYTFADSQGRGSEFGGSGGVEINYGAAPDLQLTLAVPAAYAHDDRWHSGMGDIELAAKYRLFHNEEAGFSLAVFPGVTLPTASNGLGAGRVTAFLPVWGQKDFGAWSVFGGGGYVINPGPDNRNFWSSGIAVTRQFGERFMLGLEVQRQGPDTRDSRATTSLGLGTIYKLNGPLSILASGGPTFDDGGGAASFHAYLALGVDF